MEELVLDGIKYKIAISESRTGYSATWSCPLCEASGMVGLSNGTEQAARQAASDSVREHHAKVHAAKRPKK